MNQDVVKDMLHGLYPEKNGPEFTVIFTGKKSKRVNGLYKPATKEILLHNQNFSSDSDLLYTSIHELTHHILCTTQAVKGKAHSSLFWATFHDMLAKAEKQGVYKGPVKSDELIQVIAGIKEKLATLVQLQAEIGAALNQAQVLCDTEGVRYFDVVDRDLGMSKTTAKQYREISASGVRPELGPDAVKVCIGAKNPEEAQNAFQNGGSIDQVKQHTINAIPPATAPLDPDEQEERKIEQLRKEAKRIEKTIAMLENRLEHVTAELGDIDPGVGTCVGFG